MAGLTSSKLLYPMEQHAEVIQPNMYHPFRILDTSFEAGLKSMIQEEQGRLENQGAESLNGEWGSLHRSGTNSQTNRQSSQP